MGTVELADRLRRGETTVAELAALAAPDDAAVHARRAEVLATLAAARESEARR
jgi:hypothetical protein